MEQTSRRPSPVTFIGIFWIAIGSLMALSGIGSIVVLQILPPGAFEGAGGGNEEGPNLVLGFLLRNYHLLVSVQTILGGAIIIVANAFLRRRPWAWRWIRIVSIINLFIAAALGFFWIYSGVYLLVEPTDAPGDVSQFLGIMMIIGGLTTIAIYGLPIVLILRKLRGPDVRNAFGHPSSPSVFEPPH